MRNELEQNSLKMMIEPEQKLKAHFLKRNVESNDQPITQLKLELEAEQEKVKQLEIKLKEEIETKHTIEKDLTSKLGDEIKMRTESKKSAKVFKEVESKNVNDQISGFKKYIEILTRN